MIRLKDEDIDRIFYDGDKAYTVKRKGGKLLWERKTKFDRVNLSICLD